MRTPINHDNFSSRTNTKKVVATLVEKLKIALSS